MQFTLTGNLVYSLEIINALNTNFLRTQVSIHSDGINNFAYLAYRSNAEKFVIICIKNDGTTHWSKQVDLSILYVGALNLLTEGH